MSLLLLLFGGGDPNAKTSTATLHVGLAGAGEQTEHDGTSSTTLHVGVYVDGPNALERESLGAVLPVGLTVRGAGAQVSAEEFLATLRRPEIVWVYDLLGTRVAAVHDLLALEVDEQLQRTHFLRFDIPASSAKADYLLEDVVVQYRDVLYRITSHEPFGDGAKAVVHVEASALWNDLNNDTKVGGFKLEGQTPEEGLTAILSGTGWTVDSVDGGLTPATATLDALDAKALELLRQWASLCGAEVIFDTATKRVSMVAEQGVDRGIGFRYGRNLKSVRRRAEPPRATRLFAFGRDGLDLIGVTDDEVPYVEDFTWYVAQGLTEEEAAELYTKDDVWFDDTITDDDTLLARATERLAILAQPLVTFECSVADLSRLTIEGDFLIGDTVRVRDGRLDFDLRTRVTRKIEHPLEPWKNEVELSSLQPVDPIESPRRIPSGFGTRWVLFRDTNGPARTLTSAEIRLGLWPRFNFVPDLGDMAGGFTVRATATGSGRVRFRMWDYVANAAVADASWSFDFDASVANDLVFTGTFSRKGLSGQKRYGLLAEIDAGSGTLAVATQGADFWALVLGLIGSDDPLPIRSQIFSYTGTPQYFTVPDGISTIFVTLDGGASHDGSARGSHMRVRMPVTPGEIIEVNVAGPGISRSSGTKSEGGYVGGGPGGADPNPGGTGTAGGGASDLRRTPYGLDDRVVVAGGAGSPGAAGTGGNGGWPDGYPGAAGVGAAGPGLGGTQLAGGANGGGTATDGTDGQGGSGDQASGTRYGGGGGGGWKGGGGGGSIFATDSAGAGGGSSYFDESAGVDLLESVDGGGPAGNTEILIEW